MTERAQGGPIPPGTLLYLGDQNDRGAPEVVVKFEPSADDVDAILSGIRAEIVRRGSKEPRGGWLYRWLG